VEEAYVRGLVGDQELRAFYAERGFAGRPLDVLLQLRILERQDFLERKAKAAAAAASAAAKALA